MDTPPSTPAEGGPVPGFMFCSHCLKISCRFWTRGPSFSQIMWPFLAEVLRWQVSGSRVQSPRKEQRNLQSYGLEWKASKREICSFKFPTTLPLFCTWSGSATCVNFLPKLRVSPPPNLSCTSLISRGHCNFISKAVPVWLERIYLMGLPTFLLHILLFYIEIFEIIVDSPVVVRSSTETSCWSLPGLPQKEHFAKF